MYVTDWTFAIDAVSVLDTHTHTHTHTHIYVYDWQHIGMQALTQ